MNTTYIIIFLLFIIACAVAPVAMHYVNSAILVSMAVVGAFFAVLIAYNWIGDENISTILYVISLMAAMTGLVTFGFLFDKSVAKKPLLITIAICILTITGSMVHISNLADKKAAAELRAEKRAAAKAVELEAAKPVGIKKIIPLADTQYCERNSLPMVECLQSIDDARDGKPVAPWFNYYVQSQAKQ